MTLGFEPFHNADIAFLHRVTGLVRLIQGHDRVSLSRFRPFIFVEQAHFPMTL